MYLGKLTNRLFPSICFYQSSAHSVLVFADLKKNHIIVCLCIHLFSSHLHLRFEILQLNPIDTFVTLSVIRVSARVSSMHVCPWTLVTYCPQGVCCPFMTYPLI